MLKMNKNGASLCFDQIKNKKVDSSVFWKKNLPASSVFQKSGLRNTCLFFSLKLTPQTCTYIVKMKFEEVKNKINNACYYVIQKSSMPNFSKH